MNTTSDLSLNLGAFEMERMLRQNAHEKAFELQVLAQRAFEVEKNKIVFEGRQQIKHDQDERINKLNQDLNIFRSKKINESRLQKMKERNKCLLEIKEVMISQLKQTMKSDRKRYLQTLKNLILQGMIKMIEPTLKILVRKEDESDIKGMLKDLEAQYSKFMHEQTGRDEYECTLEVATGSYITDEKDFGCGGIILFTTDSRIVCENTLYSRLELAFQDMLPGIRATLFPEGHK